MATIIKTQNLVKKYGELTAVKGISFSVDEGEIFGFLGPNGAGKTTTIKMLTTLLHPTSGTAIVAGEDVVKNPLGVRKKIGVVFQDPALDTRLTGRENLDFHARLYGVPKQEREDRIESMLSLVGLSKFADQLVKNYSGGMKRRLELARGLMHRPKVLFLDEPTLGLDVQTRRKIWKYLDIVREDEKMTVFITTHYIEEAEKICDRVAIIDQGSIAKIGTVKELKDSAGNKSTIIVKGEVPVELKPKKRGQTFEIQVDKKDVPATIKKILAGKVKEITVKSPSLEDAFVKLTGKRIRDEPVKFRPRMMAGRL